MAEIEMTVPREPKTRTYTTTQTSSVRPVASVEMAQSYKKVIIISTIGLVILILGIITGSLWATTLYDLLFIQLLTLSPTSFTYNMWVETPIPMYFKFYMWNWTNSHECNSQSGIKPHFVEMGPYVFREIDYKVNQVWNENGTVTFQRKKVWFFEESMSNGSLSDEVTNLNPIVATVASSVKYKSELIRKIVNGFMVRLGEKIVLTKTVGTLLFDGFNDTLLELAREMKVTKMPYSKFAWFYARNSSESYDGTFNMLTGASQLNNLGLLTEWNYDNHTDLYKGSCGKIYGTLGDFWPPSINNETVSIFIPDICTSLDLSFENTTKIQGLTGRKYVGNSSMLDNGQLVPSRQCYCPDKDCQPSGTLNISTCKFGAPAVVSLPHFYLADPSYANNVSGMSPNKEKHNMELVLEPTTGVPLKVKAQLQLNLLLEPVDDMSIFTNLTKVYIPMFWFTQEADLTATYASKVEMLLTLPSLGTVTFFGIAGIGTLIFFLGIFIFVRQKWRGEESEVLISKYDSDITTRNEM